MFTLPSVLRYLITVTSLLVVFTQTQEALLWQKIIFYTLTVFATEWLFYFIPFLKRKTK